MRGFRPDMTLRLKRYKKSFVFYFPVVESIVRSAFLLMKFVFIQMERGRCGATVWRCVRRFARESTAAVGAKYGMAGIGD